MVLEGARRDARVGGEEGDVVVGVVGCTRGAVARVGVEDGLVGATGVAGGVGRRWVGGFFVGEVGVGEDGLGGWVKGVGEVDVVHCGVRQE